MCRAEVYIWQTTVKITFRITSEILTSCSLTTHFIPSAFDCTWLTMDGVAMDTVLHGSELGWVISSIVQRKICTPRQKNSLDLPSCRV